MLPIETVVTSDGTTPDASIEPKTATSQLFISFTIKLPGVTVSDPGLSSTSIVSTLKQLVLLSVTLTV